MNKSSTPQQLLPINWNRETIAIILVVVFLFSLTIYVSVGISGYDEQELQYMVTVHDHRSPSDLQERIDSTILTYPLAMIAIVLIFLALSFWNRRKNAHLQACLSAIFLLLGIGCSSKVLYSGFHGPTGEASFILIGCAVMVLTFLVWNVLGQRLNGGTYVLLCFLIVLMIGMCIGGIYQGKREAAAHNTVPVYNWFTIPGIGLRIQPSEFVKAGLILLGACSIDSRKRRVCYFILWFASCLAVVAARDIGAAFVLALLFVAMVHLMFDDKRLIALILVVGLLAFFLVLKINTTAQTRMDAWGKAMENPDSYQQLDFISAVVWGGWKGLGIENAAEYFWLYAAGTDGVIAGIQAIFGLPMLLIVTGCYMTLILQCGLNRSIYPTSQPILFQMGLFFTAHFLLNYGGAIDLLPFTGITAPLLSTGGSSTIVNMAMLGISMAALYSNVHIDQTQEVYYET